MKIAFYCPNKPLSHPDPSGDLIIARGIFSALGRLGHECRELAEFRSRWFWKSGRGWALAAFTLLKTSRAAAAFRPHIWFTYHTYYKSPDVLGPWISRLLGIPYILFQPIYATKWRKDPATRIGFYLNHLALKACRHAFTNNTDDVEALRRAITPRRITYVPPGIFPEDFRRDDKEGRRVREALGIPETTPLLLTVARFRPGVKTRSLSYLFHSLALLRARGQELVLLVVGDGPMEAELRRTAENLLGTRAVFAGPVPRKALFRYYSAADLFVFPGIGESLGMVYLEAQACGLPVVALDSAGVSQVVLRDTTGVLTPRDEGSAMAEAVLRMLNDPDARRQMAEKGRRFIEEHRNLHRNYIEVSRKLGEIVNSEE